MAEAPVGEEPVPSTDREGMECVLVLDDLRELVQELEPIKEWFTLGLYLGLKDDQLREIETDHHHLQRRKLEMLSRWLRKGHSCNWRRVVEVLIQMREMVVANTIKLKYLTLTTGPQTSSEKTTRVDAVTQKNHMTIKRKWAALVAHTDEVLQDKLDNKEITSNRFQHFLGCLCSCEGKMNGDQFLKKLFKPSADVSEMLKTLTEEGAWNFLNYYLLESIIEEYGDDKSKEMMEQYKQDLTGYMLVTKIKDAVDLEDPTDRETPIPRQELFSLLKTKTEGVNISDYSLKYVKDLWESLQTLLSLPKHILVVNRIGRGCIEITWRIPFELAAYVIQKAYESEHYFKEQRFLQVSLEVRIYTKSEVGVEVKDKALHMKSMQAEGDVGMEEMAYIQEQQRLAREEQQKRKFEMPEIQPLPLLEQVFDDSASTISSDSGVGIEKPPRAPHRRVRRVFDVTDGSTSTISNDSGVGMKKPLPLLEQVFDDSASTISSDSGVGIEKPPRAPHRRVRRVFDVTDGSTSTISNDSGVGMKKTKRKGKELTLMPLHVEEPSMFTEEDVDRNDTTSTLMPLPYVEQPSMPVDGGIKRKGTESTLTPLPQHLSMSTEESVKRKDTTSILMPQPHVEQLSMSTEGGVQRKDTLSTLTMRWKTLENAKQQMERGATAVDGNTVYVNPGYSHCVWAYDLKDGRWPDCPQHCGDCPQRCADCPQRCAGFAIVNGLLTAVGGRTNDSDATNTLVSLTENRSKWTEHFPPMPVKLHDPAAVCTGNHLVIVADNETRVYVMDTTSLRWFSASSLPVYVTYPSLAVCGTELYVLDYMRSAFFSCSLPTLIQSSSAVQPETTDVWQSLANVPEKNSTLTTLCGRPVAVGGWKPTNTTYQYDSSTNSWHNIGKMPTARCKCLVASLPSDTLVVIGGFTGQRTTCDVVEMLAESDAVASPG